MSAAPDVLTLAQAAAAVGLSPARFRKVWSRWCRELAFPRPFMTRLDHGNYAWRGEAVRQWRLGREGALGRVTNDPSEHRHPGVRRTPDIDRQRAEARRLMMETAL